MQDLEHTIFDLGTRLEALNGKIDTVIATVDHLSSKLDALSANIDKLDAQFTQKFNQQVAILHGTGNGSTGLIVKVSRLQDELANQQQNIQMLSEIVRSTNIRLIWFLISFIGGLIAFIVRSYLTGGVR